MHRLTFYKPSSCFIWPGMSTNLAGPERSAWNSPIFSVWRNLTIWLFVHKSACLLIDCIDFAIFWNFAQKPLKLICISWFLWWNCNATYLTEASFEKTFSMFSKMELQIITLEVLKICYGWIQNSLSESQLNKCFFLK